jgi:reactive intermediate/imine deaminase
MKKTIIATENAPQAIGTYSQALRAGDTVYLSGQIPLDPATMQLVAGDMRAQIERVFENLKAVAAAAGGALADVVKLNVYLTDLTHFALVNEVMAQYFTPPYPARAAVGVASLPKGAAVEMDAVLVLSRGTVKGRTISTQRRGPKTQRKKKGRR